MKPKIYEEGRWRPTLFDNRPRKAKLDMLTWCGVLFGLGILAFLDTILNYGDIFRPVNSVIFFLIGLGILIRTTTKIRSRKFEFDKDKLERLEVKVKSRKTALERKDQALRKRSKLR